MGLRSVGEGETSDEDYGSEYANLRVAVLRSGMETEEEQRDAIAKASGLAPSAPIAKALGAEPSGTVAAAPDVAA
eukprot:2568771-Lingulodinium_polyedra.AAC.1